jgi:hypothetical protein
MALQVDTYVPEQIFASDYPQESIRGIAAAILPKFTPVLRDGTSLKWKIADEADTATGILAELTVADAACTVWVSGVFNIALIAWDADLDTEEKKTYSLAPPLFTKPLVS